jgi:hypothetical protein
LAFDETLRYLLFAVCCVAFALAYAWCHVSLILCDWMAHSPFTLVFWDAELHVFFLWQLEVAGTVRSSVE